LSASETTNRPAFEIETKAGTYRLTCLTLDDWSDLSDLVKSQSPHISLIEVYQWAKTPRAIPVVLGFCAKRNHPGITVDEVKSWTNSTWELYEWFSKCVDGGEVLVDPLSTGGSSSPSSDDSTTGGTLEG